MKNCFCGAAEPYSKCCAPLHKGTIPATSAEKLMRSRYSAYVVSDIPYLIASTHISTRSGLSPKEIELWAKSNQWKGLEIVHADYATVEFKAMYRDRSGKMQVHHEKSTFIHEDGHWFYVDGIFDADIN